MKFLKSKCSLFLMTLAVVILVGVVSFLTNINSANAEIVLNTPSFSCSMTQSMSVNLSWNNVGGAAYYKVSVLSYNGNSLITEYNNLFVDFSTINSSIVIANTLITNIIYNDIPYSPGPPYDPGGYWSSNYGKVGLKVRAYDSSGNELDISNEKYIFERTPYNRIFGASLGGSIVPTSNCIVTAAVLGNSAPSNGASWWQGGVNYRITHLNTGTVYNRTSVNDAFAVPNTFNDNIENFTIQYISGGPGTVFTRITGMSGNGHYENGQEVFSGSYNTGGNWVGGFTIFFESKGQIAVNATLDGQPWSGSVNYTLLGPEIINGASAPASFADKFTGLYTLSYNSGGPAGASLDSITPISSQTLVVDSSIGFTMNFKSPYKLSVTKAGVGFGTVTSAPAGLDCGATCSADFSYNTLVSLTAAPAPNYGFAGWSGANCSGTGNCAVTMEAAKNVTATFVSPPNPPVNLSAPNWSCGS